MTDSNRFTDLVARLRGPRTEQGGLWPIPNLHEEAADAIEALMSRIAALEAEKGAALISASERYNRIVLLEYALKPFADKFDMIGDCFDMQEKEWVKVTYGDLRAARAAYRERKND